MSHPNKDILGKEGDLPFINMTHSKVVMQRNRFHNKYLWNKIDENKRKYNISISISSDNTFRSSPPELFLGKNVLKVWSRFTEEHSCRSVILIKLLCNFIEVTFWHVCSHVNLLHIFRIHFSKYIFPWKMSKYFIKTRNLRSKNCYKL